MRLGSEGLVAPQPIDGAVTSRGDQPRRRVIRLALVRPAFGGDRERLLGGLLGEVKVTEEADQGGEDAAPLVAKDALDQDMPSTSGRTSTEPPSRRTGIRSASASATSTLGTSNT